MHTHVYEQFISGVERSTLTAAPGPVTDVIVRDRDRRTRDAAAGQRHLAALIDVLFDVRDELILRTEQLTAVGPQTDQRHVATVLGDCH